MKVFRNIKEESGVVKKEVFENTYGPVAED